MRASRSAHLVPLACLALVSSCGTTSLQSSWKDGEYTGRLQRVLVIGVSKQALLRRQFEDAFVAELAKYSAVGVASYTFAPGTDQLTQETLQAKLQELGITHVLVTRLVDKKTVQEYVPGTVQTAFPGYYPAYYRGWYSYYNTCYGMTYTPGYTLERTYVSLETNVYAAGGEKLVWTGVTETELGEHAGQKVPEFIQVIFGELKKQGLV